MLQREPIIDSDGPLRPVPRKVRKVRRWGKCPVAASQDDEPCGGDGGPKKKKNKRRVTYRGNWEGKVVVQCSTIKNRKRGK